MDVKHLKYFLVPFYILCFQTRPVTKSTGEGLSVKMYVTYCASVLGPWLRGAGKGVVDVL